VPHARNVEQEKESSYYIAVAARHRVEILGSALLEPSVKKVLAVALRVRACSRVLAISVHIAGPAVV
jgi:hypothetical protein